MAVSRTGGDFRRRSLHLSRLFCPVYPRPMATEGYFSTDYSQARERFRTAAEAAGATLTAYPHPTQMGPQGEPLAVDVARLGPDKPRAVIITTSATHGVEGFAGSGCQVGWLRSDLLRDARPEDVTVVCVHAINPYGFAWLRRVNEDNVDLNRNQRDHTTPPPPNAAYAEVHDWLVPADWDGPARQAADLAIHGFVQDRGLRTFQAAVSEGQYEFANGIFYGGTSYTWSAQMWRRLAVEHIGSASAAVYVDLHTGLGPYGDCELINPQPFQSPGHHRAIEWWGDSVKNVAAGESTSARVQGTMDQVFDPLLHRVELTAITLEYGVKSIEDTLHAVRADNWLHLHGDLKSDLGGQIKGQIRDTFYGDEPEWKRRIYETAERALEAAFTGLSSK